MTADDTGQDGGFAHANGFDSSRLSHELADSGFDARGCYHFASRLLLAESWRIAAELVSRHPELRISRVEGTDQNPLLVVHRGATGWRAQFDLFSGISFERSGTFHHYDWLAVFAQDDPLVVIKKLQVASGLRIIPARRRETPCSLAYQAIAGILSMKVNSSRSWQAHQLALFDGAEGQTIHGGVLDEFPSAQKSAERHIDDAMWRMDELEAASLVWQDPLWVLSEDFTMKAIIDELGLVHCSGREQAVDIRELYETSGRDWAITAGLVLRGL